VIDAYEAAIDPVLKAQARLREGMPQPGSKQEDSEEAMSEDEGTKSDSSLDDYEKDGPAVEEQLEVTSAEHQRRIPRKERILIKEPTAVLPAAPAQPWVSAATSTSLTVTWLPPSQDYNPPFDYVLQYAQADSGEFCNIPNPHEGQIPAHVVQGLTTGTSYVFRVQALLGGQCGEPSPISRPFTVETPFRCCYSFATHPAGVEVSPHAFTGEEMAFFRTLDTPQKVQDWLDDQPMNHEVVDDTCLSPLESLRQNHQHCIEGAMLAAYILSLHGHPPLLCDMRSCSEDDSLTSTSIRSQFESRQTCDLLSCSNMIPSLYPQI